MLRTINAAIDTGATARPLGPGWLECARQGLLTILEHGDDGYPSIGALLSESSLATDWSRSEATAAWQCLQWGQ